MPRELPEPKTLRQQLSGHALARSGFKGSSELPRCLEVVNLQFMRYRILGLDGSTWTCTLLPGPSLSSIYLFI